MWAVFVRLPCKQYCLGLPVAQSENVVCLFALLPLLLPGGGGGGGGKETDYISDQPGAKVKPPVPKSGRQPLLPFHAGCIVFV